MGLILNIDTAVEGASFCLAQNDEVLGVRTNPSQKDSAAWLHTALQALLHECGKTIHQLNAVAVSAGPGSYTGLRVGMATAKGLCYALNIPLLTINTLQMMAVSASVEATDLLCPMIDARRMEVFLAIYNTQGKEIRPPQARILQPADFDDLLQTQTITFFGNGSPKLEAVLHSSNAVFKTINADARHMVGLAFQTFSAGRFADLAYSEPFYGKEFYSPAAAKKFVI